CLSFLNKKGQLEPERFLKKVSKETVPRPISRRTSLKDLLKSVTANSRLPADILLRKGRLANVVEAPGVRTAKNYEQLSGTEQAMILAQNDPAKVRSLAGALLDTHAKLMAGSHVRGTGQVTPESYRDALASLRQQFLSLARAADDGYISATDWVLLATLIPSTSTEIKNRHGVDSLNLRGQNYSRGYRRYDSRGEYRVY